MSTKRRSNHQNVQAMRKHLTQQTTVFPQPHANSDYWHLPLPVARDWIDAPDTSLATRTQCVQMLVNRAQHLITLAPPDGQRTRVVVAITLPKLFDSQLIVFFGTAYFLTFFTRDTDFQRWTPLPPTRSFISEWDIHVPTGLMEQGYEEEINDEAYQHCGERWFIGQLQ